MSTIGSSLPILSTTLGVMYAALCALLIVLCRGSVSSVSSLGKGPPPEARM